MHDSAPAFTPDGNTVYFTRGNSEVSTILVSHRRGARWTEPTVAPFSGEWSDMEPAMAPDGSYLVFVSNRPAQQGAAPLDGRWGGKTFPRGGGNLWRVNRKDNAWSAPVRLPDTINASTSTFAPSIVRNGSIYFMRPDDDGNRFHVVRSPWTDGAFQPPVAVSFNDPAGGDVDPAVAPDESYAVFSSSRGGNMDLYLVVRAPTGAWATPRVLAELSSPGSDAEARLSPDGKTLYFASDRVLPVALPRTRANAERDLARGWDNTLYNIWQADLAPLLTRAREQP
jgi:Tol biopolymer transport system component